jgi:hypothetical protein
MKGSYWRRAPNKSMRNTVARKRARQVRRNPVDTRKQCSLIHRPPSGLNRRRPELVLGLLIALVRDPDVYFAMTKHAEPDAFALELTLCCLPQVEPFARFDEFLKIRKERLCSGSKTVRCHTSAGHSAGLFHWPPV